MRLFDAPPPRPPRRTASCARDSHYPAAISILLHVMTLLFVSPPPIFSILCKHTLTNWNITEKLEQSYLLFLMQNPPKSGIIMISLSHLLQEKVASLGLVHSAGTSFQFPASCMSLKAG